MTEQKKVLVEASNKIQLEIDGICVNLSNLESIINNISIDHMLSFQQGGDKKESVIFMAQKTEDIVLAAEAAIDNLKLQVARILSSLENSLNERQNSDMWSEFCEHLEVVYDDLAVEVDGEGNKTLEEFKSEIAAHLTRLGVDRSLNVICGLRIFISMEADGNGETAPQLVVVGNDTKSILVHPQDTINRLKGLRPFDLMEISGFEAITVVDEIIEETNNLY